MSARPPTDPPVGRAPTNIQARRVLALARLLTTITALICVVGHVLVVTWTAVTPADDQAPLDAWFFDVRLWAVIFLFWAVVMWMARRPLRLDSIERDR